MDVVSCGTIRMAMRAGGNATSDGSFKGALCSRVLSTGGGVAARLRAQGIGAMSLS